MPRWTVDDEINLQRWVREKGFKIVFIPGVKEWGFVHKDKPQEINGGFKHLSHLKKHFVEMKGQKSNIIGLSRDDFLKAKAVLKQKPKE